MVLYECVYLMKSSLARKDVANVMKSKAETIFNHGGVLRRYDNMGVMALTYPMYKFREKHYKARWVYMLFDGSPNLLNEVKSKLEQDLSVFRYAFYKQSSSQIFRDKYDELYSHYGIPQGELQDEMRRKQMETLKMLHKIHLKPNYAISEALPIITDDETRNQSLQDYIRNRHLVGKGLRKATAVARTLELSQPTDEDSLDAKLDAKLKVKPSSELILSDIPKRINPIFKENYSVLKQEEDQIKVEDDSQDQGFREKGDHSELYEAMLKTDKPTQYDPKLSPDIAMRKEAIETSTTTLSTSVKTGDKKAEIVRKALSHSVLIPYHKEIKHKLSRESKGAKKFIPPAEEFSYIDPIAVQTLQSHEKAALKAKKEAPKEEEEEDWKSEKQHNISTDFDINKLRNSKSAAEIAIEKSKQASAILSPKNVYRAYDAMVDEIEKEYIHQRPPSDPKMQAFKEKYPMSSLEGYPVQGLSESAKNTILEELSAKDENSNNEELVDFGKWTLKKE